MKQSKLLWELWHSGKFKMPLTKRKIKAARDCLKAMIEWLRGEDIEANQRQQA